VAVYIVEDDPLVREVFATALDTEGYDVVPYASAEAAFAAAEVSGAPPEAWVVDIELGDRRLDGLALGNMVRLRWPSAGVVYVTAFPHLLNDRRLRLRERACAKPCDITRLTALVGGLIETT